MEANVSLDQRLSELDELLTKWGRYSQPKRKRELSNTAVICERMEMFLSKKKLQKSCEKNDVRRDLVLGLPTKCPKADLQKQFEQIDIIFNRLDLWVFHMRDRDILKKYYIDTKPTWGLWRVAKTLSVPNDQIKARQLSKRLRQALIYFSRLYCA